MELGDRPLRLDPRKRAISSRRRRQRGHGRGAVTAMDASPLPGSGLGGSMSSPGPPVDSIDAHDAMRRS
jgi:hypothetical protein